MILAIHTVFILRENFLFLEEWVRYHLGLGFDHIYLYDNSGSIEYERNFGGHNKYDVDFRALTAAITEDQLSQGVADIARKFNGRLTIINWSPKSADGEIIYVQKDTIIDYFEKYSKLCDWTAFIDIDEFIYCSSSFRKIMTKQGKSDAGSVILQQKKFMNRFDNLNKRVVEIFKCIESLDTSEWGMKVIVRNICFDPKSLIDWGIHFIPVKDCSLFVPESDKLRFNHYNVNQKQMEWMKGFFGTQISFNANCYQLYNKSRRIKSIR